MAAIFRKDCRQLSPNSRWRNSGGPGLRDQAFMPTARHGGWKRPKPSNEKPSPRSSSAFGLWALADGHHDVNIGCALPHHEGAAAVGISRYALQLRRVGNDYHRVRSGLHPLVVTGWGFGIRVGVAASHITRQHVDDADVVGFERLLVHPGVMPRGPCLVQAHGHVAALLPRVWGGIARVGTGARLEDRTIPVLHDGSFGHLGRGGTQGLTDQCLLVLRACLKKGDEQKEDQNHRQSYNSSKDG